MLKCETVITGNTAFFKQYEDILNIEIKTCKYAYMCQQQMQKICK